MKFRALFPLLFLWSLWCNAQSPSSNFVVNGYIYNLSNPVPNAMVYVQLLTDSVMTDSTRSQADGSYEFNFSSSQPFLVGYLFTNDCTGQPISQHFFVHQGNNISPSVPNFQICHPQPIGQLTVKGYVTENGTSLPMPFQSVSMLNSDNQYAYAYTDSLGYYTMDIPCFQSQGSVTVSMNNCNQAIMNQVVAYNSLTDTLIADFDYCAGVYRGLIPITGQYRRPDGTPIPNQYIYISANGLGFATVITDSMGYYATNYRIPSGSGNVTFSFRPDCFWGLHDTRTVPFDDNTNFIVLDIEICPAPQTVRGVLVSNNAYAPTIPAGERIFLESVVVGGYNTYVSHDGTFEFPISLYTPSTAPVTIWFVDCAGDTIRRTANLPANASGIDFGTIAWCSPSQTRTVPNHLNIYNSNTGMPASGVTFRASNSQGWVAQFTTDSVGAASFRMPLTSYLPGMVTYSMLDCNGLVNTMQQGYDIHTMYIYGSLDACPSNHVTDPCFRLDSALLPLTIVTYGLDALNGSLVALDSIVWTSPRICLDSIITHNSVLWFSSANPSFLPTFVGMDAHGNIITHATWDNVGIMHPGLPNLGGQGLPLNMLPRHNITGTSTLSGNVGIQRTSPLDNAYAVLMDLNGVPLATAMLDANGNYNFPDIASGDYQVMIQAVNYSSRPANVNLQGTGNVDFRIVGNSIFPSAALGTEKTELLAFEVFPNPTSDLLRISTTESIQSIVVFDQVGRAVLSKSDLAEPVIDLGSLANGMYSARIILQNGATGHAKIQVAK